MFKDFWEKKKHIIESTGILTAIGALFLNLKIPENESARNALLNIQMIWLFIISIMGIILFFNFAVFTAKVEKKIEEKISHEMPQSIFFIFIMASGFWFLYNLWKYLLSIYKNELAKFIFFIKTIPLGVASIIVLYYKNEYIDLYIKGEKYKYYRLIIMISIVSGFTLAFLTTLFSLKFDVFSFLILFFISSPIILLYCLFSANWKFKKVISNK